MGKIVVKRGHWRGRKKGSKSPEFGFQAVLLEDGVGGGDGDGDGTPLGL